MKGIKLSNKSLILIFLLLQPFIANSQSSCASPLLIGTPTSIESCQTLTTAGTGSSPCSGPGYGGPGGYIYVNFCTNSDGDCISFVFNDITTGGNWAAIIYDATCVFTGLGECMGTTGSGASFNTSSFGLAPSTCYIARIWVKTSGDFEMCTQSMSPGLDICLGALPISSTPQSSNNYCTTPGPTTNTPTIIPADLCAGSLENTAWYSFVTLNTGDVVVTIENIICSGGASGFQIGYFVGSCGGLINIGCQSGSGGTVTATIIGLIAGDEVYIAIDGNAGANCTYDISATNTVPLPIELIDFNAFEKDGIVYIDWATVSETNNNYFTIEKSRYGSDFEFVDEVLGAGTSNQLKTYGTIDKNPYNGLSYYRLKQTDFDGKFEYSDLKTINILTELKFSIKPNPAYDRLEMTFGGLTDGVNIMTTEHNAKIKIYDIQGKLVYKKKFNGVFYKFNIDISNFEKGMYFVSFESNGKVSQTNFVKE